MHKFFHRNEQRKSNGTYFFLFAIIFSISFQKVNAQPSNQSERIDFDKIQGLVHKSHGRWTPRKNSVLAHTKSELKMMGNGLSHSQMKLIDATEVAPETDYIELPDHDLNSQIPSKVDWRSHDSFNWTSRVRDQILLTTIMTRLRFQMISTKLS